MPLYYFHLAGHVPAHDVVGHECENDEAARKHGELIAHKLGTERPEMIAQGYYISVRDKHEREVARFSLASDFAG